MMTLWNDDPRATRREKTEDIVWERTETWAGREAITLTTHGGMRTFWARPWMHANTKTTPTLHPLNTQSMKCMLLLTTRLIIWELMWQSFEMPLTMLTTNLLKKNWCLWPIRFLTLKESTGINAADLRSDQLDSSLNTKEAELKAVDPRQLNMWTSTNLTLLEWPMSLILVPTTSIKKSHILSKQSRKGSVISVCKNIWTNITKLCE